MDAPEPAGPPPARPVWSFGTVLSIVLLGWAALGATVALLPGISAANAWAVLLAAVVLGLLGAVLRPLMTTALSWVGWLGVVAGWLVAQAVLVYLALTITPGIEVTGFAAALAGGWLGAALMTIGFWLVTAGQPGAVTAHLLRVNRRFRRRVPPSREPGLIMIQIDGLSAPLARWAVASGAIPTIGRWLRSGSHTLTEWHARLPATTPASQAGILHGAADAVPAFRWYEKETGRLVVTNRPRDSALVESRMSDGHGLLAGGGVSVGNVFSGDASHALLTMSRLRDHGSHRPARYVTSYLLDPFGFTRSLVLTAGEIVKELYQARRQRLRRIEPRIARSGWYLILRGVTNVLLRELNIAVIAEQMMRGAPAVYCDFVDYDEIAHHAGPTRPEAMAALEGIDGALATLAAVARAAPRPYRFVLLSDHGQSQGATFRQRYGVTVDQLIRGLATGEPSVLAGGADEQAGRSRALRAGLVPDAGAGPPEPVAARPEFVVASSGNLALVYLARRPGRVLLEDIEEAYPKLLSGLLAHPGIGWVSVRSRLHGPVVLGAAGRHLLATGLVEGHDPLAGFGPHAAADLLRHDGLRHTGDLLVNSAFDAQTQEVAAFEELVGCHGGLGGWQDQPVLIHPREWPVEPGLASADEVHRLLRSWLASSRRNDDAALGNRHAGRTS